MAASRPSTSWSPIRRSHSKRRALALRWIKRQRTRFNAQSRQSEREMISGESHYFSGGATVSM